MRVGVYKKNACSKSKILIKKLKIAKITAGTTRTLFVSLIDHPIFKHYNIYIYICYNLYQYFPCF